MFIGREYELNFLNERYNSGKAEFIVLYGRRRVGKTELLSEFCKGKKHIFYTCNEYTNAKQLNEFSRKFLATNSDVAKIIKQFLDWESAFSFFGEYAQNEKMVIVIDEFPYMVKGDSSIPSILQNLWDHNLKNKNIMLILSGSAMSFIENELLGYKNPLYGRTTATYKLEPMPYYDAVKFFPNYSDEDKTIAYAILGGIPHYLNQFDAEMSLEENIKKKILQKSAQLYDEVDFLLHQELREPAVYITIIEAIALGCTKYTEICDKSNVEGTKLSMYLKNLVELGIVIREMPALSKNKDQMKRSQGEYVLADSFFRFYYSYVYPHKAELDTNNVDLVWKHCIKNDLHRFASKAFENMSIRFLHLLNGREELPCYFTAFARWWGKVTRKDENGKIRTTAEEIDVVSSDISESTYLVGECKFTNAPFDMGQYKVLAEKHPFCGTVHYYLFSLNGFTDAVVDEAENNENIHLITLDDMMREQ